MRIEGMQGERRISNVVTELEPGGAFRNSYLPRGKTPKQTSNQ